MKKKSLNIILVKFAVISIILLTAMPGYASSTAFQSGIGAYSRHEYIIAEHYFRKALLTDPNNTSIRYYLAITLVKNNKAGEAREEYQAIIDLNPYSEAAEKARHGLRLIQNKTLKKKVVLNINGHNSALIVRNVKINNHAVSSFILDTGATYTSISTSLARELGVLSSNAPRVNIMTANGAVNAPKVILKSIEIDGLIASNVEVIILDISATKDVAGLLGLNFIQKFKLTIDKRNGELILENP
ncbi:MAG: hypothetical protein ACD_20C00234G0028 [uncultured bacterium]|nr:MAG: hypothetical protein ACD_20C00234G0028 [uncultured bacterium]